MTIKRATPRRILAGLAGLAVAAGAACAPGPAPAPPDPLLSRGNGGVVGDLPAFTGAMSMSGNIVAFTSYATNIAPGATGNSDLFVRDRAANTTVRLAGNVTVAPHVSPNGRWVGFRDTNSTLGVYDRTTAGTTIVNQAGPTGLGAPTVPDDGSVAIYGNVDILQLSPWNCKVESLSTAAVTSCPAQTGFGEAGLEGVSANGRHVLYRWRDIGGGGGSADYLWDRVANTTVPVPASVILFWGGQVSDDGQRVVGLGSGVTVNVWDRGTNTVLTLPTAPNGTQTAPASITPDGRYVAFTSDADNQVANDTNATFDVFSWDLSTNVVRRASHGPGGAQIPTASVACGSGGGQYVGNSPKLCVDTYEPLAADDTNAWADLYALTP